MSTTCLIWDTPATDVSALDEDGRRMDSPRAGGRYFVSGTAKPRLERCDVGVKIRLTTWLVEQRRLGNPCPEISTTTIADAELRKDTDACDRADGVLRYLATMPNTLGATIDYRIFDHASNTMPLDDLHRTYLELLSHSDCTHSDELDFLMSYLQRRNFIEFSRSKSPERECIVTVDGHTRLTELERIYAPSSRVFVAMWFDKSMEAAWSHGFAPAIRDTGYEPVRVDCEQHIDKIDDWIIAEIRRARFVVADFTQDNNHARGSVYYEAGFAYGLAIPVMFSCRKDSLENVHFDTRQYNHIVWTEPNELRVRLATRISAVMGDGPKKAPSPNLA